MLSDKTLRKIYRRIVENFRFVRMHTTSESVAMTTKRILDFDIKIYMDDANYPLEKKD